MEIEKQLADFAERIESGCGRYVSYDEVQQWPNGRLDELKDMEVLIKSTPATKVDCVECWQKCPAIEPTIEELPNTGEKVGLYICKKEGGPGLIKIPLKRLRRWEIVVAKLEELGYCKVGYEVLWDESNELYIPQQEAVNMAHSDSITLKKMSKLLQDSEFPVHRMRRAQRCRVHIQEYRKWLRYAQHGISDAVIEKYLEKVEKRKEEARLRKKPHQN